MSTDPITLAKTIVRDRPRVYGSDDPIILAAEVIRLHALLTPAPTTTVPDIDPNQLVLTFAPRTAE